MTPGRVSWEHGRLRGIAEVCGETDLPAVKAKKSETKYVATKPTSRKEGVRRDCAEFCRKLVPSPAR
jgi:hypothetical protein